MLSSRNFTTVAVKIQAPVLMKPSNESTSLIEWSAHQQAKRQQVDNRVSDRLFLWSHGYEDVTPGELFA